MKNDTNPDNVNNLHNLNGEEKDKEKRGARLTPRLFSTLSVLVSPVCGCSAESPNLATGAWIAFLAAAPRSNGSP
jgi:hypothetical protein